MIVNLVAASVVVAVVAVSWIYLRNRESVDIDDRLRKAAPGKFVRLSDGSTHYDIAGPESGPVIVFMNGATLSLWIWNGLFGRLASMGYRVLRYDYYGRGYSDRPNIDHTMDVFHRQLTELLKALHIKEPVTLAPLAFGCPIAASFVIRDETAVRSLCLVAPDGFGVPLSPLMKLCFRPVIGPPLFQMFGSRALEKRLVEYTYDAELVETLRKHYVPELAFKGFKAALTSSLRSVPIHNARSLYEKLNWETRTPMVLIWGTADRVTAITSKPDIADLFSRAETHFMEGVGHLPHWERLEETAAIIDRFLVREASKQVQSQGARFR